MKHLQAVLVLALLIASKRYRERWQHTIDQVDASLDAIAASRRRIDAMKNSGPPKVRVV